MRESSGGKGVNPVPPRYRASDRLWRKGALTVVERAVGEVIARHMDEAGVAFPGYKRIAEATNLSVRSVGKAVKVLVNGDAKRGILPLFTREPRYGKDGRPRGSFYRFVENPEALMRGRAERAAKVEQVVSVLQGRSEDPGLGIPEATKEDAEQLRRQDLELQKRVVNKELAPEVYKRGVAAMRKEFERRARKVVPTRARRSGTESPDQSD